MARQLKHIWYTCPICSKRIYVPEFIVKETKINPCNNFTEHILIGEKKLYSSISQDKRQLFLDNFHKGLTVGESYKAAGLTQDEGFVVLKFNIGQYSYLKNEAVKDV